MILVTGATGFAGSHLLERLPASARITAWARPDGRAASTAASNVEWQAVDLLDRHALPAAIASVRPDLVYHLAGAPHVAASFENPSEPLAINAAGTHNLLNAIAAHAPASRVVVVTSAMIYGPSDAPLTEDAATVPSSPYGLSKLAQDRLATLAAADGVNVVVARPFNHTGPRQSPTFAVPAFAQQIARIEAGLAGPVLHVGNLDAERDLTDVRDTVDGYAAIAARGTAGVPYNVCSGQAWRVGDLLEQLLRKARVKVRVEVDPGLVRAVELPRLMGDNSRLRALGWSPRVPLETTLDDVLGYWRAQVS